MLFLPQQLGIAWVFLRIFLGLRPREIPQKILWKTQAIPRCCDRNITFSGLYLTLTQVLGLGSVLGNSYCVTLLSAVQYITEYSTVQYTVYSTLLSTVHSTQY